jgi:hypothetical protein
MDLGYGLRDVLAGDNDVRLVRASIGDSGLARPEFYDWPKHVAELLAQHHPAIVVVFLGANDGQAFIANGARQEFGRPSWHAIYSQRVATVMSEATAAGSRMLWIGMPIMRDTGFSAMMRTLNDIYQSQAAAHPGVTYFPSWELFSDARGGYTKTPIDSTGHPVVLRTPDGIHIAFGSGGGGADYLAQAVVDKMRTLYGLQ